MSIAVDTRATALTRARYNRIAPIYDVIDAMSEGALKSGRKKLCKQVQGDILEVGVGTGKNFEYYPRGARVVGIDLAERMLARARERAQQLGIKVKLREADVQALDFADNIFDTAVATCVFCSVPDPVQGLCELNRVIKPGGRILLLEHVRIDHPIIGRLMDWLNPLFVRLYGANLNRRTVENVEKAGLEIDRVQDFGPMQMVKLITARPNKAVSMLGSTAYHKSDD